MIDLPVTLGWLLTYAVHRTLLLGAAWLITRMRRPHPVARDIGCKAAVLGGLLTASIQTSGWRPALGSDRGDAAYPVPVAPLVNAPVRRSEPVRTPRTEVDPHRSNVATPRARPTIATQPVIQLRFDRHAVVVAAWSSVAFVLL